MGKKQLYVIKIQENKKAYKYICIYIYVYIVLFSTWTRIFLISEAKEPNGRINKRNWVKNARNRDNLCPFFLLLAYVFLFPTFVTPHYNVRVRKFIKSMKSMNFNNALKFGWQQLWFRKLFQNRVFFVKFYFFFLEVVITII